MMYKDFKLSVFLILPLLLIIIGSFYKAAISDYSMFSVDPEYCYLFNGLNLVHYNFPWHIDHPGTPLQMLSAIVIRIVHLFRHDSIDVDLFKNPDFYVNAINYTIIYLQAIVLFITGLLVFRFSKNYIAGLFIQITPLASFSLIMQNRIIVEQMELIAALLLIIAIFWFLYSQKHVNDKIFITKYVIVFSVIFGFGVANKILFAPLFIIPFILLPNLKQKFTFTLLSGVSFSIFAFPIFNRWTQFSDWIKNLFIHNGQYGNGAETIIDANVFRNNLHTVFHTDFLFPIVVILSVTACIAYQIPAIKKHVRNENYYKALLGSTLATLMLIVIVCKQYRYIYLVPVLALMIFELYLIVFIFFKPFSLLNKKYVILTALLLFCSTTYSFELNKIFKFRRTFIEQHKNYLESKTEILKSFNNKPKLIIADYYGAPYIEYALYFGNYWSGEKMREYYANTFHKLYPDSYIYQNWDRLFYSWGKTRFSFYELLKKHNNFYLYSGNKNFENALYSNLHGLNRTIDTRYETVYKNEKTNEIIYLVTFDSNSVNHNLKFTCDAEIIDSVTGNFTNAFHQQFENGSLQSKDFAHSGKCSVKVTSENPYGLACYLSEVDSNDFYKISVWLYNNKNDNSYLVIEEKDPQYFYVCQNKPLKFSDNWYKLEIEIKIPAKMNKKDLKIYCWNNDKLLPAYFDDLEIIRN